MSSALAVFLTCRTAARALLVNLALYEQRIGRAQKEAFRQLYDLQDRRKAAILLQAEEAKTQAVVEEIKVAEIEAVEAKPAAQTTTAAAAPARHYPLNIQEDTPDSGQEIGFVCSTPEIAAVNPILPVAEPVKTPFRNPEFTAELKAA